MLLFHKECFIFDTESAPCDVWGTEERYFLKKNFTFSKSKHFPFTY